MGTVETPPDVGTIPRHTGPGSGYGEAVHVIVLNDDHNTFEGVATILSTFIPGVDYAKGMKLANTIHRAGRARVWSGHREPAELYWDQLRGAGLTMAPLA